MKKISPSISSLPAIRFFITIFCLAGCCFGKTTISLSSAVGPPTTNIYVSGSGFTASVKIDLYFDSTDVGLATANKSGTFSKVTISAPATAQPGNHTIKAVPRTGTATATATFLVRTDWAQFHRDNMERWNPYENTLTAANVGGLQMKWAHTIPGTIYTTPAYAGGVLYVASDRQERDGSVYALDPATGSMLWSYHMGTYAWWGSPAVAKGLVYVGNAKGTLLALNATTGALVWRYDTGSFIRSSITVVNNVVYFCSDNSNVYALNASTGVKLWSFLTQGSGNSMLSSPAVVDNVVYVGAGDNNIYALNASTGAKLWSYATGNGVGSSPAVANGVVYVSSDDGNLYALNATAGALVWLYPAGGTSPAVANGVVYVGAGGYPWTLFALDAATGSVLWSFSNTDNDGVAATPAVANGVVYIASYFGSFYAIDANTGALLWGPSNYEIPSSVTVADGTVYFGSGYSTVYAFGLQ